MLAAAEQQLTDGDLDGARQNVAASRMWLDDSALPERGRTRRDSLQALIDALTQLDDRAERLEGQRRCKRITEVAEEIAPLSPALAGRWRERAGACRATKQGGKDVGGSARALRARARKASLPSAAFKSMRTCNQPRRAL